MGGLLPPAAIFGDLVDTFGFLGFRADVFPLLVAEGLSEFSGFFQPACEVVHGSPLSSNGFGLRLGQFAGDVPGMYPAGAIEPWLFPGQVVVAVGHLLHAYLAEDVGFTDLQFLWGGRGFISSVIILSPVSMSISFIVVSFLPFVVSLSLTLLF